MTRKSTIEPRGRVHTKYAIRIGFFPIPIKAKNLHRRYWSSKRRHFVVTKILRVPSNFSKLSNYFVSLIFRSSVFFIFFLNIGRLFRRVYLSLTDKFVLCTITIYRYHGTLCPSLRSSTRLTHNGNIGLSYTPNEP